MFPIKITWLHFTEKFFCFKFCFVKYLKFYKMKCLPPGLSMRKRNNFLFIWNLKMIISLYFFSTFLSLCKSKTFFWVNLDALSCFDFLLIFLLIYHFLCMYLQYLKSLVKMNLIIFWFLCHYLRVYLEYILNYYKHSWNMLKNDFYFIT